MTAPRVRTRKRNRTTKGAIGSGCGISLEQIHVSFKHTCVVVAERHNFATLSMGMQGSWFELESSSSKPHLPLSLCFSDDFGRKAKAGCKMSVSFHLENDIVDDVVHGGWWGKQLR
jgi:hypothetical protein